jgi:methylase of polypeptide subunit release factors
VTHARALSVVETLDFDGLAISFDQRVLRPRSWTVEQSRWAASLMGEVPHGPVLELCAGAGQIGLAAIAGTPRRLVCVDADRVACQYAAGNAAAAGMTARVEIRHALLHEAVPAGELFSLVIADPPWVPHAEITRFPADPTSAIDGGDDGLDVARACVAVIGDHLAPRGAGLLQLGTTAQVEELEPEIEGAELTVREVRRYARGVVALLEERAHLRSAGVAESTHMPDAPAGYDEA